MDLFRLLKLGQVVSTNLIKATYKHTLVADWSISPVGVGEFNDKTGRYEDSMGNPVGLIPQHLEIAAYFDESPNLKYKYAKYGIDVETDIIAIIPEDTVIPDTTAVYTRKGQTTEYKLKNVIEKADIGVAPGIEGSLGTGMPQTAYRVLHLRSGNMDS